jgi:DNA polymerase-4
MNDDTLQITIRIPSFAANVEREHLPPSEARPLVVVAGEGTRALVLSADRRALQRGVRPGQRTETLPTEQLCLIPATPARYVDEVKRVCDLLARSLPLVHELRTGWFGAHWSKGDRFLARAMTDADHALRSLGHRAAWGVSRRPAVAEIASRVAQVGRSIRITEGEELEFLDPLPLSVLPDLERLHREMLYEMGVTTLGDILALPEPVLEELFGRDGIRLRSMLLQGQRPSSGFQWHGKHRLGEDESDVVVIHRALADLVAEAISETAGPRRWPSLMTLLLLYTDEKRVLGRVGAQGAAGVAGGSESRPVELTHEGYWQRAMRELLQRLWTRRVRLAELRVSVKTRPLGAEQFSLFEEPENIGRERRLAGAVQLTRQRWGTGSVQFASVLPGGRRA